MRPIQEAAQKRDAALEAALEAGFDALVARTPATVRWLLCGRGQPVDVCAADYTVLLLHRHPLPTDTPLGRHALLALTAERDGLFVSVTRLISFGAPPRVPRAARTPGREVDAAVLDASRPGASLGELLEVLADAYAERGFPEEWRRHHQGGLTGYRGREVFATPGDETRLVSSCAVAWNPSIRGGAKSEDTALVGPDGAEIVTTTPALPLLDTRGVTRPGIVEL